MIIIGITIAFVFICGILMLASLICFKRNYIILTSFTIAFTLAVIFTYMSINFSWFYLIILEL